MQATQARPAKAKTSTQFAAALASTHGNDEADLVHGPEGQTQQASEVTGDTLARNQPTRAAMLAMWASFEINTLTIAIKRAGKLELDDADDEDQVKHCLLNRVHDLNGVISSVHLQDDRTLLDCYNVVVGELGLSFGQFLKEHQ